MGSITLIEYNRLLILSWPVVQSLLLHLIPLVQNTFAVFFQFIDD